MTTTLSSMKKVVRVAAQPPMHWVGDGFPVRSLFSYHDAAPALSPFLLLDYAAPRHFSPSENHQRGVGEHPHRGFETVTIAYQGEIEHRDSTGAGGKIGPGDVQWMTAASGVVHEELHGKEFSRKGGTLEMVQLWVNLPAKLKMSKPGYQDILDRQIPAVALPGGAGTVRVIAGAFSGTKGPARTFTKVDLWDVKLEGGHAVELAVPEGHTTAVVVLRGEVGLNGTAKAGPSQLVLFDRKGDRIALESRTEARILLLGGEPIDEPVFGYGPFVMNTEDEIRKAFADYEQGKMGSLG